jgi:hypothetical protein
MPKIMHPLKMKGADSGLFSEALICRQRLNDRTKMIEKQEIDIAKKC